MTTDQPAPGNNGPGQAARGDAVPASVQELRAVLPPADAQLLEDVRSWQTTEAGWNKIREVLGMLTTAVADGDTTAARKAFTWLKTCSPVRVVREPNPDMADSPPSGGLPQDIGETVNQLVHTLGLSPPPHRSGPNGDDREGQITDNDPVQ